MKRVTSVLRVFSRAASCKPSPCCRPPVAINGFGRIGTCLLRKSFEKGVNVVAVNQPFADINTIANALTFDTVHGYFNGSVNVHENDLCIDGKLVKVFHETNPEKIKWKDLPVDYVIDSSGKFAEKDKAMAHIKAGVKKVIVSTPSKTVPMFVKGVNFDLYQKSMQVVSNASCTTNCAAPLIKALHKKFCVVDCLMTTTHAMTASQHVHDGLQFRSGVANIVPSTTGAATAVGMVVPELQGKVKGDAARVPVLNVSLLKLYMNVKQDISVDAIKNEIKRLAETDLKDVLSYLDSDNAKCTSSDLIGCQYSAVVDLKQIQVIDKLITVGAWYDNEVGYSCRVLDLLNHMIDVDGKLIK